MLFSPQDFYQLIAAEIEDRMTQQSECGDDDYAAELEQEIEALSRLNDNVLNEKPLSFIDYQWLCDLCTK